MVLRDSTTIHARMLCYRMTEACATTTRYLISPLPRRAIASMMPSLGKERTERLTGCRGNPQSRSSRDAVPPEVGSYHGWQSRS